MNALAPALRMVAGAVFLFLLLLPSSVAQAPTVPAHPQEGFIAITVLCERTMFEAAYAGQDIVTCAVQDHSRDSVFAPGSTGGTSVSEHTVALTTRPANDSLEVKGWQVIITEPYLSLYGGDVRTFRVIARPTPTITAADYNFEIVANYTGPGGYAQTVVVPMSAQVDLYDFATTSMLNPVQRAGQDDLVTYSLSITNVGVYPDSYRFTVNADPDIRIATPPNVFVPPGETRIVNFTFLTPHGKLFEQGRSVPILVKVNSITGSGVYSAAGSLQIRGPYIPIYWIPLLLVGLVSASVVVRGTRERAEIRRLEAGRPRRVQPTPRQAVLLAELRRQDKDAYKEKAGALDVVYRERVKDYREHRKERAAIDREESKRARIEYVAAKKRRKEEKKAARKQAAIDRKAEKKRAKVERKELKAKKKQLAKATKKLEKARKKADKIAAKEAKAQAKRDAAAAKAAEKEARKAKKAAKKRGEGP